MRIEQVRLDPKTAQEWFDRVVPEKQRAFREHHAIRLSQIISAGDWRTNNDAFMFSKDGYLGNGQHRAAACVRAGKSIDVVVYWDCTEEQIKAADQGSMPRRSCDALALAGFKNTTNMAAVINRIHEDFMGQKFLPSHTKCIAFASEHREELVNALNFWNMATKNHCPVEPSMICAIYFLASDKEKAMAFCTDVATGVTGEKNSPVWFVLRRFQDSKDRLAGKMSRHLKTALIIKAYQSYVDGEEMKILRWSPGQNEEFPQVP